MKEARADISDNTGKNSIAGNRGDNRSDNSNNNSGEGRGKNCGENYGADKKIWVVFSGQTDLPWLKCLKSGFRHCFVVMHDGRHWVSVDPMANYMEVTVHQTAGDFDFIGWIQNSGLAVVRANIRYHSKPAPIMPLTCVEAVKRILGLRRRLIITPWQLYKFLRKSSFPALSRGSGRDLKSPADFKDSSFKDSTKERNLSWEV